MTTTLLMMMIMMCGTIVLGNGGHDQFCNLIDAMTTRTQSCAVL